MQSPVLLPRLQTNRKIIHLDMDAFYASVEMLGHPEYHKLALIVSPDPRQNHGHGVVTTANYCARQYGVHSAMPANQALKLVPADKLLFVPPHFEKYRYYSEKIHQLMHVLTDQMETVALDEAYLDVTHGKKDWPVIQQATWLQAEIFRRLKLTASFGISYNKFLAKTGSDYAKPFGRTVIRPHEAEEFLQTIPLHKFHGIGQATLASLAKLGIQTVADLQAADVRTLTDNMGRAGYELALHAHGIDNSPVVAARQRKSISSERTFTPPLLTQSDVLAELQIFAQQVSQELQAKNLACQAVVLKIRDRDFKTVTRRISLSKPVQAETDLYQEGEQLLAKVPDFIERGVHLLGLGATNLIDCKQINQNLSLF
ncbi:MAG: DNA polymerase IV [Lactobacillus sp.]|jgi:DNA polymerase-4|nr:DNA polymerase IV [Lactobacillus sp.]MCH3905970.1 DNA polymerase IV [Lactobacillus sp.]MCH3990456.1 DNA polymerase IV [Lactobacillus sp.]MCH4068829.1 DNA polymerase IV [Lactobacillus sp.]MCI1304454.1 DNA polymerase IV [Lactobacillus sp.]